MKEPVKKETAQKAEVQEALVSQEEIVLNDAQIQAWKKQFGKIFKTTVGGESYIWRKLKRREYVEIMSSVNMEEDEDVLGSRIYQRQEKIAKLVVLYPANIEQAVEEDAGLATTISDEVILKSGFDTATTEEL